MSMHWHTYSSIDKAAEACCRNILPSLEEAVSGHGLAKIALSGGSTPKPLFRALAESGFDWKQVHVFWVDERMAPPSDPESNFLAAEELFLKPAHVPLRNIHRIHGELRPDVAAENYSQEVEDVFSLAGGELPHFDVVHLGIGADAHIASLFPGEPLIGNREDIASSVYVEKLAKWRVTLLPGVLLNAKHIVVLAGGEDKAEPIRNVMEAPYDPMTYPAQLISHHGRHVTWFVDGAAAALTDI
ncbi:MAG: 6-phosphogluconolactonase [Bryobacterales bacterium]|nr:6-phosphogluconolactonase [Bryobacterales bacterium]